MQANGIAVYGAGGFGRGVASWIDECQQSGHRMQAVCFVDDDRTKQGTIRNGLPVMGLGEAQERFPQVKIVVAVGSPGMRRRLVKKAKTAGLEFATVIHPRAECSRWVETGSGTVICAGNTLSSNSVLGKHVHLNMHCTIGHDVIIEDYATLAPGVHVSGYVHLGRGVQVGTGAVFVHGTEAVPLIIEDDAVVGAGACVTKPVLAGTTVVGVPARPLPRKGESAMSMEEFYGTSILKPGSQT